MKNERVFEALKNIQRMIDFLEDDTCTVEFAPTVKEMLEMQEVMKRLNKLVSMKINEVKNIAEVLE